MEEINKKDLKKLLKWQQFILDMAFAMQDLTKDMDGQRLYIEPLKKHSTEMYANAKILQKVTGQELEATDKEAKDGRSTLKFFSLRRLFSVMSGICQKAGRKSQETESHPEKNRSALIAQIVFFTADRRMFSSRL